MSQLDEILAKALAGKIQATWNTNSGKVELTETKEQIKDLMLEVIGEDDYPGEPQGPDEVMDSDTKEWYEKRNGLRAIQRKKLEEL